MPNLYTAIQKLQERLSDAGIPSVVIGGVAVAIWGDPRVTRDADLKTLLERKDADRLLAVLTPHYVSLLPDPHEALRRQAMVFVQDADGIRLDLLLADTPYDVIAIRRGCDVEVQSGVTLKVCSPEDLVIYKLLSPRPRDYEDVRGVVRRQGQALDDAYVLHWLRQFELALDDSTLVATYRRIRREFDR
ncbi:MAG: nucleotidyltransferase family protein [Chloroflexi bacterium]|nr:nucleotidyltransferase family protein [Chloroflexota bacterium]